MVVEEIHTFWNLYRQYSWVPIILSFPNWGGEYYLIVDSEVNKIANHNRQRHSLLYYSTIPVCVVGCLGEQTIRSFVYFLWRFHLYFVTIWCLCVICLNLTLGASGYFSWRLKFSPEDVNRSQFMKLTWTLLQAFFKINFNKESTISKSFLIWINNFCIL